ncbi:hypothetical protein DYB31_015609 [Aphanomyces astaci]|uniref:Uncharacterized protein n=1 Tax=Aphanomyces astaci TaxID=112090 RepID=A0A397EWZ5_APHAT|nr:hypothetical protein DYB31_015609 [Aphanomyces astaci]
MVEFLGAGEEALTSSTEKEDTASPRTKSAKKSAPPADLTIRIRKQRAAEVSRTKEKQSEALIAKLLAEETFPSVKNLGPVARCLGMIVHRIEGGFFLEQTSLVEELLAKHGLSDAKTQATPLALDHRYFDDGPDPTMTATEMREVIGSLLWLAGSTRRPSCSP